MSFGLWSEYRTYDRDLSLLRELGLKPFKGKIWDEIFVGKVETENALIFIWVTGAPAQFFRFSIVDFGNYNTVNISTGSGTLGDYWPHVEKMAEGMFTVNTVHFERKQPLSTQQET